MQARLTAIDRAEVLRYLGCPPSAHCRIEDAASALMQAVTPRLVWRRLPLCAETAKLIEGNDLKSHLAGCTELVLFAATLGMESEAMLRRAQLRALEQAVVFDACASSAIENVCDNFCTDLAQAVAPQFLTERFSPGYGDYPLCHQKQIFELLDVTRRIGVTLTDSDLMVPQKSVTAIIGISDTPQPHPKSKCAACRMFAQCTFRKENRSCESANPNPT